MSLIGKLLHKVSIILKIQPFKIKLDTTVSKIIIISSGNNSNYKLFINSINNLYDDYDIQIFSDKEFKRTEHGEIDLLIYFASQKKTIRKYSSVKKQGVFVEDLSIIKNYKCKKEIVFWSACSKKFIQKDNYIPINFNTNGLLTELQLKKNISYRIRDGIDFLENKKNYYSTLLLPNCYLHTGRLSFANKNFKIKGKTHVSIGSYCSFGENVLLVTENHDTRFLTTQGYMYQYYYGKRHPGTNEETPSKERTKGPIIIQNDVWIGDRVIILSGVNIGNGACIAAGSIVTKDVEPYIIVAGVPAKKVGTRFDKDAIRYIESLNWWDWSKKKFEINKDAFFSILK